MTKNQKSELLLPVGNMNMCLAAIHNGADAIYVGVPHFNARGRTTDLSLFELQEIIETCHLYGVKVNLAFNVVIFEDEIDMATQLLRDVLPLNPDAIIVQDVGLARLIRAISPTQIIHASTQMTITNHEAISLLEDLDIKRFVLGREVSLPEIKAIKDKTDRELEVFVHGALCVAYSGQCFTSESIGGRSANRGQCAQSCRFEYDLFVDGEKKELGDIKYLVSPKDLCGIAEIPELVSIGVQSFKVEGRLKTAEYVAAAAKNYRRAIDQQLDSFSLGRSIGEMGVTYSRGFFSGWLHGVDHQQLVDGTYGSHRGHFVGLIHQVHSRSIVVSTSHSLKNGDGVLIASHKVNIKAETGGLLFDVKENSVGLELFFHRDFSTKNLNIGDKVYLNHDHKLSKDLNRTFSDKNFKKRILIDISAQLKIGSFLSVTVSDGVNQIVVESDYILLNSHSKPTSFDDIHSELAALGPTCFKLSSLKLAGDESIYIPQKVLKNIRRDFTEKLIAARTKRDFQAPQLFSMGELKKEHLKKENRPVLNILFREIGQIKNFISFCDLVRDSLGVVILDYEFGKGYAESVELLKSVGIKVAIATTRILKPNEYYNFKIIERAQPDVVLVRNLGALHYFADKKFELMGDFSLNVTNSLTADYFLSKNLQSVCASYDLDFRQLSSLLHALKGASIEVTIHQYMPSFHMEHCVFAAFLSNGSSFRDCGKPCEQHRVELKDQFGHFHHIKADQECRNTMFNATSQSAASLIPQMMKLGVSQFRFEALYESGKELEDKIKTYAELISNPESRVNLEAIDKLGLMEKYGLSNKLLQTKEHRNRKKDR